MRARPRRVSSIARREQGAGRAAGAGEDLLVQVDQGLLRDQVPAAGAGEDLLVQVDQGPRDQVPPPRGGGGGGGGGSL